MTASLGIPTTIEQAKGRLAAHWFIVALFIALSWAVPLPAAGSTSCEVGAGFAADVSSAVDDDPALEGALPKQHQIALANDETSDDVMGAPRQAQLANYRPDIPAASVSCAALPEFLRHFNPRAPPLTG